MRDEKVKVLHAIEPMTPEQVSRAHRARAVRGRASRPASRSRATSTEEGVPRRLAHGDLRRAAARGPQLALGRRADLPAHRQAAGAQGDRDRRACSSRCRTWRSSPQGSVGVKPNQLVLTMQPNEGVSLSLGAKIPGTRMRIRPGEHGVPLRHRVHVAVAGGLRAADHRRDARRRDAVHARRRDARPVGDHRPDPAGLEGGHDEPGAHVPVRLARGRRRPTRCSAKAGHWRPL